MAAELARLGDLSMTMRLTVLIGLGIILSSAATPSSVTACSTGNVTVTLSWNASIGSISGAQVSLAYPNDKSDIPGSGSDPSVASRVSNLTGVSGLFGAADAAGMLQIGLVTSSAIQAGP